MRRARRAVRGSSASGESSACQMSTQRRNCRLSSTSHSSPTCQPWFSPMMRRITGARLGQAVRARQDARDHVLQRQQPLGALALGDLALQRHAAGVERRLLARVAQHVALLADDEQRQDACPRRPSATTSGTHAHRETTPTPYTECGQKKQPSTWSMTVMALASSEHADVAVQGQERQRHEDRVVHLGPAARDVNQQRRHQALPDRDLAPGGARARPRIDHDQRQRRDHRRPARAPSRPATGTRAARPRAAATSAAR